MKIRLEPCEVLRKRNTDHRKVDAHNVAEQIGTDHRGQTEEGADRRGECTALCERLWDFCRSEKKTKTKTDGTKQLPTAPAARGNAIVRVWFPPTSLKV